MIASQQQSKARFTIVPSCQFNLRLQYPKAEEPQCYVQSPLYALGVCQLAWLSAFRLMGTLLCLLTYYNRREASLIHASRVCRHKAWAQDSHHGSKHEFYRVHKAQRPWCALLVMIHAGR